MFTLLGYTIGIKNEFGESALSFYKKYIMLNLNEYDSFGGFNFYINIFLWLLTVGLCVGIFFSNYKKNKAIRLTKKLLRHGARTEDTAKTLGELGLEVKKYSKSLTVGTRLSRVIKVAGAREISYEEYVKLQRLKKQKKKGESIFSPTPENTEVSADTANQAAEVGVGTVQSDALLKNSAASVTSEQMQQRALGVLDSESRLYIPESADIDAQTIAKKGESTPLQSTLAAVFCVCISVCMTFLMPVLLGFLNNLLS